jgi:ligand-binding sensor domain-containing protein
MSTGEITRYLQTSPAITALLQTEAVKPPAVLPAWENHVSQRSVRAVVATLRSGCLWLATWGGVLAWNRKQDFFCLRYSSEHGLAANGTACLALDEEGTVWAGHDEGGLSYFADGRWHIHPEPEHEAIRALCAARGGGVWAATSAAVYHIPNPTRSAGAVARKLEGAVEADVLLPEEDGVLVGNAWGLFRLRGRNEPEQVEPQTLSACTGLARDGRGDVWVATPEDVYRLCGSQLDSPVELPADRGGVIQGLAAGKDVVWVWTSSGLASIEDGRCRAVPWPETKQGRTPLTVRAVGTAGDDRFLWVGTDDRLAVVWFDGRDLGWSLDLLPAHPEDALNNLGRCATGPASDGSVRIGTAGGLVAFGPDGSWSLDSRAGNVRGLCGGAERQQEPGVVYLLAWPRGIGRWRTPGPVEFYSSQPDGIPLVMAVGQDGHLYALTTRGLWRFQPGAPECIAEAVGVAAVSLAQTPDRTWWLGTSRGVWRRTASGRWEPVGEQSGPAHAEVTDLAVVGDTLWVATTAGLWEHDASGWSRHVPDPTAEDPVVRAVAPAGDPEVLWLACGDRLTRYAPAERRITATYLPRRSGLGSVRIAALREAGGVLWAVTAAGISRLTLDKGIDP